MTYQPIAEGAENADSASGIKTSNLSLQRSLTEAISMLGWREGRWKPFGKDLETALQSQEARLGTVRLSLNKNQLTSIPDSIGSLTDLKWLNLEQNQLTSLPDCIGFLTNLIQIDLENNHLSSVPDSIGSLINLARLYLHNNRLKTLPHSIINLKKLEFLTLEENSALPPNFQQNVFKHSAAQELISDISIHYRKRAAARSAALFIIARYGEGDLAVFPRDLIKLIAREVWETQEDDSWMNAGEESNPISSKGTKDV